MNKLNLFTFISKEIIFLVPHATDEKTKELLIYRQDRQCTYRGADKFLARPTSRCILFDGEYISFDASLVIYK